MKPRNSSRSGNSFSEAVRKAVWAKGRIVPNYDHNQVRKDQCGSWMIWQEYGNTDSEYGWEVDHMIPVARGGGDEISNLQPLQWQNNRSKGDNYPRWQCAV